MTKPRVPLDPVADLKRRLARTARLRGVSMNAIRTSVRGWWRDHGLADHPATVGKRIALALIEQRMTEDKLAGILVLHEQLGDHLRATDLPAFAERFANGHLADANVVDGFGIKVLATLLDRAPRRADVVHGLAAWRTAETIWQRRAACVGFVKLAPGGNAAHPGLVATLLAVCGTVVWSHERFDQTAVGWLLRELSRAEPRRVEVFFRRYAQLMSRECARVAVAKLPADTRSALLAHHKRATSLRR